LVWKTFTRGLNPIYMIRFRKDDWIGLSNLPLLTKRLGSLWGTRCVMQQE